MTETGNGNGPIQAPRPMSDETESELDGVPYGLLMWGQAGVYNAVDDRLAVAGMVDSQVGVVRPPTVEPGNGLDLTIQPPWLAVADCGDGTRAVCGSRQTHTLTETGGPQTGQRIDHIWCETRPDDGLWLLKLVPEAQTVGLPGVSLGRVTVPAGANTASAMTFSRLVPTMGRHAEAAGYDVSGTTWANITPDYPIPPYALEPGTTFRVSVYGEGRFGNPTRYLNWRMGISNSPVITITPGQGGPGQGAWINANEWFEWEAEGQLQVRTGADRVRSRLRVTVSRYSNASQDKQAGNIRPDRTMTATRSTWGQEANISRAWQNMQIRFRFANLSASQLLRAMGSQFDVFQSYRR